MPWLQSFGGKLAQWFQLDKVEKIINLKDNNFSPTIDPPLGKFELPPVLGAHIYA